MIPGRQQQIPDSDLIARFVEIVGEPNATVDPDPSSPFLHELRGTYHGRTPLLLRPESAEEVSAILSLADMTGTAIVPQGGNTGLVGGQIPDESGAQIIVALDRMNKVRSLDPGGDVMVVEAGVTLTDARLAADGVGRMFPLALGSMEWCQIGGNISTNAGGVAVLAYGNSRDLVFGLEVVLADGTVLNGLRALRKDNAGYDLKQLFIGAEGTLGIITAAALKLLPKPKGKSTAFVGVAGPDQALELFHMARSQASQELTSFELMPRICIDFCLRHLDGAFDPLSDQSPWYVLFEVTSGRSTEAARSDIEAILAAELMNGSAWIAPSSKEAAALWKMRLSVSNVQRPEGASIKHDISVPISAVPAFLDEAIAAVTRLVPECRPVPFGHLGDGNIHFNISQPEGGDGDAFLARRAEINGCVHDLVAAHDGSIAAEHGIGRMKRALLPAVRSPAEMDIMRRIKAALDPNGILNPGKVL